MSHSTSSFHSSHIDCSLLLLAMAPEATNTNGASSSSSSSSSPDWSTYLGTSKPRLPAPIRSLFPLELIPGMISLLAGKPNADTYPFASINLELKPGPDGTTPAPLRIEGKDLEDALQYGATAGLPRLNKWLVDFQSHVHRRHVDAQKWQVTLGVGSQDLLSKSFEMLLDPDVDSILVEEPAYAGILPCLHACRANVVPIASDDQGVDPQALEEALANFPKDKPKPKCLYTTPTGANPSGTTASEQRKRDILAICRRHSVLILEDDPYYFLDFSKLGEDPVTRYRPLSYFALDGESASPGLVLRYDSFSKVLSGGMRLGYLTAHPTFVKGIDLITGVANLSTSGAAQCIALAILEHWGVDGFLQHADRVATFYRDRRDRFEAAARRVLGRGPAVAEWITPTAGMFLWLKLKLPEDEQDSFSIISNEAKDAGVLAVPGGAFMPMRGKESCYVRTSFSLVPESDFEEGFERLRRVIEGVWKRKGLSVPA